MDYAVVSVPVSATQIEAVEEALGATGFTAFAIAMGDDGRGELNLYGAAGHLPAAVGEVLAAIGIALPAAIIASDRDLLAAYLPDTPSELAPGVWVDPRGGFTAPAASARSASDRPPLVIRLPPLPAFGDGHHPTTRLAARLLDTRDVRGLRVLDLGCGTGVLGILAALRGAAAVDFADIDLASTAAASEALQANGVPGRVLRGDLLGAVPAGTRYDLIVANLYGELLLEVAADPRLAEVLPRGHLVFSGVSRAKAEAVHAAFAGCGFAAIAQDADGFWTGAVLVRAG